MGYKKIIKEISEKLIEMFQPLINRAKQIINGKIIEEAQQEIQQLEKNKDNATM